MRATTPPQRQSRSGLELPLWWSREFAGELPMVGEARSWIAELFPAGESLDDLLMVADELAANARAP
jgi:hypothetical protein